MLDAGNISYDFRFWLFQGVDGKVLCLSGRSVLLGLSVSPDHRCFFSPTLLADFLHVSKLVAVSVMDGLRGTNIWSILLKRSFAVLGLDSTDGLNLLVVQVLVFSRRRGGLLGHSSDCGCCGFGLLVLLDGLDLKSLIVDVEGCHFSRFQNFGANLLMETSDKHLSLNILPVVINAFFLAGQIPDMASIVVLVGLDLALFSEYCGSDFFEFLKDGRNLAVEVSYGLFRLLLEVLEVGADDLGCTLLVVDSQELGFDDVELGEVLLVGEVLDGIPPSQSIISHKLPELDEFLRMVYSFRAGSLL